MQLRLELPPEVFNKFHFGLKLMFKFPHAELENSVARQGLSKVLPAKIATHKLPTLCFPVIKVGGSLRDRAKLSFHSAS